MKLAPKAHSHAILVSWVCIYARRGRSLEKKEGASRCCEAYTVPLIYQAKHFEDQLRVL